MMPSTMSFIYEEDEETSSEEINEEELDETVKAPSFVLQFLLEMNRDRLGDRLGCDLDVVVEEETFSVHRIILTFFSDYFKAMLEGSFQEQDTKTVNLSGISKINFSFLLDFMYGCDIYNLIKKDKEEVQDIVKLADMLCLDVLTRAARNVLAHFEDHLIHLDNIYHLSQCFQSWPDSERIHEYVFKHYLYCEDVAKSKLTPLCISYENLTEALRVRPTVRPRKYGEPPLEAVLKWLVMNFHSQNAPLEEEIFSLLNLAQIFCFPAYRRKVLQKILWEDNTGDTLQKVLKVREFDEMIDRYLLGERKKLASVLDKLILLKDRTLEECFIYDFQTGSWRENINYVPFKPKFTTYEQKEFSFYSENIVTCDFSSRTTRMTILPTVFQQTDLTFHGTCHHEHTHFFVVTYRLKEVLKFELIVFGNEQTTRYNLRRLDPGVRVKAIAECYPYVHLHAVSDRELYLICPVGVSKMNLYHFHLLEDKLDQIKCLKTYHHIIRRLIVSPTHLFFVTLKNDIIYYLAHKHVNMTTGSVHLSPARHLAICFSNGQLFLCQSQSEKVFRVYQIDASSLGVSLNMQFLSEISANILNHEALTDNAYVAYLSCV